MKKLDPDQGQGGEREMDVDGTAGRNIVKAWRVSWTELEKRCYHPNDLAEHFPPSQLDGENLFQTRRPSQIYLPTVSSSFSCFLHFVCMLVVFFVASQLSRDSGVSCEQLVWDFTSQCSLTVPSFWRCWLLVYLLAVIDTPMSGLKPPSACRYLCLFNFFSLSNV